jgi:AraC-like DNA-binding protein
MTRARLLCHDAGGSGWELAIRPPAPRLRGLVLGDYVGYVETAPGPVRRWQFAAPSTVLIFELGPPTRLCNGVDEVCHAHGFVAGISDRATLTSHDGRARGVQVDLTPRGARSFLGAPMATLAGRLVALDDVLGGEQRSIGERLADAGDWDARFDLIDRLLIERAERAGAGSRKVAWALERIEASGGRLDVGALARELGHSAKYLIDQFREHVGLPPKLVARLVRFDRVVRQLRRGGGEGWAELAALHGYYDQAHLVRDFRQFTGVTPTAARASLTPWLTGDGG